MKFPLPACPFPTIHLSDEQCAEYEQLTNDVVAATRAEYDQYVGVGKREMPRRQWKAVKARDDVTVYKRLQRDPSQAPPRVPQPAEKKHWSMPKLVAVGTIAGTLDDIMYGIVTPDAPTIVVKTSYVNDELLDSAVLKTIHGATYEDPYRFLGMKWIVKGHSASINAVVWPRDVVFVESTGIHTLPTGERVGYHVMHSVENKLCRELTHLAIVRSEISSCYLYKQVRPGIVELYMMTYVEPGGNPPESIAIMSTASSLIGIWKSMWCAQNKKICWILDHDPARRQFQSRSITAESRDASSTCCQICSKKFRTYRSATGCQLCSALVCSRCCVGRKLSSSNDELALIQRVVELCKNCVGRATNEDALRIAREQYVGDDMSTPVAPFDLQLHKTKSSRREDAVGAVSKGRQHSTATNQTLPGSLTDFGSFDNCLSWREESDLSSSDPSDVGNEGKDQAQVETIEDWERSSRRLPSSAGQQRLSMTVLNDPLDHQQQLYLQMQSLCVAAEETFQITALTASRIQEPSNRVHPVEAP